MKGFAIRNGFIAFTAAAALTATSAAADDGVKIGLIVTLSGPAAVLGGQISRRLPARGQDARRQTRRRAGGSHGRR